MSSCINPNTGLPQVITSGVSAGGPQLPTVPAFGAKRVLYCFRDAQEAIQEGRRDGYGVWNVGGATDFTTNNLTNLQSE